MKGFSKKHFLFLVTIVAVLNSCTAPVKKDKYNQYENSFNLENKIISLPEEIKIKTKKINVEIIGLWHGISIDSLYMFRTGEHVNSLLLYNATNWEYVGRLFESGQGPNEFLSLETTTEYFLKGSDLFYWVYDHVLRKIRLINITQSLNQKNIIVEKEYSYDDELIHLSFFNDTTILGARYTGRNFDFGYLHLDDMKFVQFCELLKSNQMFDLRLVSSNATLKPDKSKYALAMIFFNQMIIAETDGSGKFTVSTGEPLSLNYLASKSGKELKKKFGLICSTDNQIWAIYNDMTIRDFRSSECNMKSKIIVFDWDGNVLYNIQTDQKLNSIFFNEYRSVLYGIDINEIIYEYSVEKYVK